VKDAGKDNVKEKRQSLNDLRDVESQLSSQSVLSDDDAQSDIPRTRTDVGRLNPQRNHLKRQLADLRQRFLQLQLQLTTTQSLLDAANRRLQVEMRDEIFNFATFANFIKLKTRCRLAKRFASAWPELIIACDVRGRGEWLHRSSWPPLQLACAAYRLFAHAFRLQPARQTDTQTEGQTSQSGYLLRLSPLRKKSKPFLKVLVELITSITGAL